MADEGGAERFLRGEHSESGPAFDDEEEDVFIEEQPKTTRKTTLQVSRVRGTPPRRTPRVKKSTCCIRPWRGGPSFRAPEPSPQVAPNSPLRPRNGVVCLVRGPVDGSVRAGQGPVRAPCVARKGPPNSAGGRGGVPGRPCGQRGRGGYTASPVRIVGKNCGCVNRN